MKTELEKALELKERVLKILNIDLTVKSRVLENASYRAAYCCYITLTTSISSTEIGKIVSREHATILHYMKTHAKNLVREGNKGDTYRIAWANIQKLAKNKSPLENDLPQETESPTVNVMLRKQLRTAKAKLAAQISVNQSLSNEVRVLKKEVKRLNHILDIDSNRRFDTGDLVKPVTHNFKPEPPKPWRGDVYEVSGIKYF